MSDTYRAARRAHRQLLTYIALLAILCIVLALTSCSSESEAPATAEATEAPATTVSCEDVWQAGAELPTSYDGCLMDDGSELVAAAVECSDGTSLLTYEPSMWGITGKEIHETETELAADKTYAAAYEACIA